MSNQTLLLQLIGVVLVLGLHVTMGGRCYECDTYGTDDKSCAQYDYHDENHIITDDNPISTCYIGILEGKIFHRGSGYLGYPYPIADGSCELNGDTIRCYCVGALCNTNSACEQCFTNTTETTEEPTEQSERRLIGPEACQRSGECFWNSANNQCFCYLDSTASPQNWAGAQQLCRSKQWELPHPTDIVALRSGLHQWCGNCGEFWLDAKCSGSRMFWQIPVQTPLVEILSTNPLFAKGQPDPMFKPGVCLETIVTAAAINGNPTRPYYTANCEDEHVHILCQKYN